MKGCIYCGGMLERPTPEHVIPRSLGAYEFVIDVCGECNSRANRWIDTPIVQCSHVRRVRADLGLVDVRGRPHEVSYIGDVLATTRVDSGQCLGDYVDDEQSPLDLFQSGTPIERPGMRAHVRWDGTDRTVNLMGASGRPLEDGYAAVYRQDDDEPSEAVYDPNFEPYTIIAIAQLESRCNHHLDTWERFAAKAGLGLIELIRTGHAEASLDEMATTDHQARIIAGLRALAMPSTPPPRQPSGCRARIRDGDPQLQHQVALVDDKDAVVVWVLLFGILDLQARIPGARLQRDAIFKVPVKSHIDTF